MKQEQKTGRRGEGRKTARTLYAVAGIVCTGLGALGVALPILPTTPFLMAAAFCFARSSEKLDKWFQSTNLYKNHLETARRGDGMTWGAKLRILATVTAVMAIAVFFMLRAYFEKGSRGALIGCIVMAVVWAAHVIAFCFFVKTCPKERAEEIARERAEEGTSAYDAE